MIRCVAPGSLPVVVRPEARADGDLDWPEELRIEVTRGTALAIEGRVVDVEGAPVADVQVRATLTGVTGGGDSWQADTTADGRFRIELPAGIGVDLQVLRMTRLGAMRIGTPTELVDPAGARGLPAPSRDVVLTMR